MEIVLHKRVLQILKQHVHQIMEQDFRHVTLREPDSAVAKSILVIMDLFSIMECVSHKIVRQIQSRIVFRVWAAERWFVIRRDLHMDHVRLIHVSLDFI